MKVISNCRSLLIGLLVLLMAIPPLALGQQPQGSPPPFRQEELDQMLAPIALYPDSLLAQVLVAATYPVEVVQADRWVKQKKNLQGDRLNDALDQMSWDLSVKALVPFPQVLSMMSEQLEWTQTVGDAFLAQQTDVMDTIQKLRAKAHEHGSLKTTSEQKVIVEEKTIIIEPASPTVVYVPAYNPTIVYGSWWYPAYPPYPYYPAGAVVTAGVVGFAAGVAVGAAWCNGWGRWNWGHNDIDININRNININRDRITNVETASWRHDPAHRGGVPYRDAGNRARYGQPGTGSPERGNDYRGYSPDGAKGAQGLGRQGAQGGSPNIPTAASTLDGLRQREGGQQRQGPQQPQGATWRDGSQQGQGASKARSPEAFQGMDSGREDRLNSDRGRASRETSFGGLDGRGQGAGHGAGGFEGLGGGRGGGGFGRHR